MGAQSQIYVDPAIAADSGAGTTGSPYGDLEWAIEQEVFDTTNGTQVNVKAGATAEILANSLDVAMADTVTTAAWVPTEAAPLTIRGYTSAKDDGGIGDIDGDGTNGIFEGVVVDYVSLIDLKLHNTGATNIISGDNYWSFINCELYASTGMAIDTDSTVLVINCYLHDIGGNGITIGPSARIMHNYFENGATDKFNTVLALAGGGNLVYRNIFDLDSSTSAIVMTDNDCVMHNSLYANSGTGKAIQITGARNLITCINNIVEGFAVGYDFSVSTGRLHYFNGNVAYNNTTNYSTVGDKIIYDGGTLNETLSKSAFTDAPNRDFSPDSTAGSVKEGAEPSGIGDQ